MGLVPPTVRGRCGCGISCGRAGLVTDRRSVRREWIHQGDVQCFDGVNGFVHVSNDLSGQEIGSQPQKSQPIVE